MSPVITTNLSIERNSGLCKCTSLSVNTRKFARYSFLNQTLTGLQHDGKDFTRVQTKNKAQIKRHTFHASNSMQMSKSHCLNKFALSSAHDKFNGLRELSQKQTRIYGTLTRASVWYPLLSHSRSSSAIYFHFCRQIASKLHLMNLLFAYVACN